MESERNQIDDQTDGHVAAVNDEPPEPDYEELAVGALENADIRPWHQWPSIMTG